MADTTASKTHHGRNMPKMPFIMPDGRPLGAYLTESNGSRPERHKRNRRHQRGNKKDRRSGWTDAHTRCNLVDKSPAPYLLSQLDHEDVVSLNKLGQRKQQRWKNDLLLRAMAPELTADAIDGLFKPVPFGDTHPPSPFTQVAEDESVQHLWQMLLSVTAEKQQRILDKWDATVQEMMESCKEKVDEGIVRDRRPTKTMISKGYSQRWHQNVSATGKAALRKAPAQTLQEIETKIIPCLFMPNMSVDLHANDGFGRLLAHSIAQFHGLSSKSMSSQHEGRYVHVSSPMESNASVNILPSKDCPVYIRVADFVFIMPESSHQSCDLMELQREFTLEDVVDMHD